MKLGARRVVLSEHLNQQRICLAQLSHRPSYWNLDDALMRENPCWTCVAYALLIGFIFGILAVALAGCSSNKAIPCVPVPCLVQPMFNCIQSEPGVYTVQLDSDTCQAVLRFEVEKEPKPQ